ncbi:DNA-formamidopyrimidine glycosylase family protein [Arcanobacterium hippocoleae]
MPELPEVETIRAGLDPFVRGKQIQNIETYHPRVARHDSAGFQKFAGQTVTEVARRGKYLWFCVGEQQAIVAHLRMSGQFRVNSGEHPHRRASFSLPTVYGSILLISEHSDIFTAMI